MGIVTRTSPEKEKTPVNAAPKFRPLPPANTPYHLRRSKMLLLRTSLVLLPPGSALVQSMSPLLSTPNMLIFCIALTNAASHMLLLSANALNGTAVNGC